MSNQSQNPYSGITPEELHIAVLRAHAERAKVVSSMVAALLAWLGRASAREQQAHSSFKTAAGR